MTSIIVPIYKVEEYLPRCVDSLLGQTDGDFELILVDDGSPDRCGAICDEYAAKDPRIVVIHKENGGLSDARNAGLEIARGEYIAFVDSDDWVSPRYLELLRQRLETTGSDICECGILRTEGACCPEPEETAPEVFDTVAALEQLIRDGKFHQYVWNKLYRREVIGDISFPKGRMNEDDFWTYQIFGRAKRVAGIDAVLYNYFQRPGSIMGSKYTLKCLDQLDALQERQQYLEERYPQLAPAGRVNMLWGVYYHGCMTLRFLTGEERGHAFSVLEDCLKKHRPRAEELKTMKVTHRFWAVVSGISLKAGCILRNILGIG